VSVPDEILIVLVIHEMDLAESPAFHSLSKGLSHVQKKGILFVYDNSTFSQTIPDNDQWTIYYQHDATNPGVSHAYNIGFAKTKQLQLKGMLFVDQDTLFPEIIFQQYHQSIKEYPDANVFAPLLVDKSGIISPFQAGLTSGRRLKEFTPGKKSLNDIHAINSGLLVTLNIFEKCGGYDERLRLDFSDFNFFKRLQQYTASIVLVDAECQHEHSSTEKTSIAKAISRFEIYLQAVRIMGNESSGFLFQSRALLRALKLSFQYRSFRFIGSFLFRES
jgi:rhamnosyltransferase